MAALFLYLLFNSISLTFNLFYNGIAINMTYMILKKYLFFALIAFTQLILSSLTAQELIVEGKVTTFDQYDLKKAVISAKRSGNETTTDSLGNYTIATHANDVLTFSAKGFYNEKVKLSKVDINDSLNVNLKLKNGEKNFQYATGYGHIEADKLSYAIQHFGSGEDYSGYESIIDVIKGRVTGVSFYQNSIQIRGASSMSGDIPALLVVDGSVVNYSVFVNIPPTQIKSIDVLKGASASARYGSRGMGGVIVVQTKSNL